MSAAEFDPNRLNFEEGLERIRRAVDEAGLEREELQRRIITSRDDVAVELRKSLATENVPEGFQKWQLPVYLACESQMFVTIGDPGVKVPQHSHEDGDGIRFIAGGSIIYEGRELTAGDWMFIPAGEPYSFEVGPNGAIMCYCY